MSTKTITISKNTKRGTAMIVQHERVLGRLTVKGKPYHISRTMHVSVEKDGRTYTRPNAVNPMQVDVINAET